MHIFDQNTAVWVVTQLFGGRLTTRLREGRVVLSAPSFDEELFGEGKDKEEACMELADKFWLVVESVPDIAYLPLRNMALARHEKFKTLWESKMGPIQ